MITLKQALEAGKLDDFIAEHKDEVGDPEEFNRLIRVMTQKSEEARQTSSEDDCDD